MSRQAIWTIANRGLGRTAYVTHAHAAATSQFPIAHDGAAAPRVQGHTQHFSIRRHPSPCRPGHCEFAVGQRCVPTRHGQEKCPISQLMRPGY